MNGHLKSCRLQIVNSQEVRWQARLNRALLKISLVVAKIKGVVL